EALRVALEAGDVEDACRAYVNLVWNLLDWFRLDEAERYLTAAMKLAEESEFFGILSYMQVARARLDFARGSWDEAVRAADAAARAEDAWLHGDHARVRDIATPVYQQATRLGDRVHQAELGYWLAHAGQPAETASGHPYAVQAAGRWREAAALWEAAGSPYER